VRSIASSALWRTVVEGVHRSEADEDRVGAVEALVPVVVPVVTVAARTP